MISTTLSILILILFVLIFYQFKTSNRSEVSAITSDFDHREYLVLNLDDKDEAAYLLSVISKRIDMLKDYLQEIQDDVPEYKPYIKQLIEKSRNMRIQENAPGTNYTSYTLNKGEMMAICCRSAKDGSIHDINIVMYVVLHELSHVACPEVNHTPLFKEIFKFLVQVAASIKLYKHIDYKLDPHEYCGVTVNENILH